MDISQTVIVVLILSLGLLYVYVLLAMAAAILKVALLAMRVAMRAAMKALAVALVTAVIVIGVLHLDPPASDFVLNDTAVALPAQVSQDRQ